MKSVDSFEYFLIRYRSLIKVRYSRNVRYHNNHKFLLKMINYLLQFHLELSESEKEKPNQGRQLFVWRSYLFISSK